MSSDTAAASSAAPPSSLAVLENALTRFSEGVTQLQQQSQVAQKRSSTATHTHTHSDAQAQHRSRSLSPLTRAADRLEIEFGALDACVKSHELQLKEYQKLVQMMEEIEREQGNKSGHTRAYEASSR